MLFNSAVFPLFFLVVYGAYLALGSTRHRAQNRLLVVASYVFYGWWDWRFCGLLALSTVVDFVVARRIHASADRAVRRRWMGTSLAVNLGVLGFFKYVGFFADSFTTLLDRVGMDAGFFELQVLLPVGISFYTFQTLSYTVDVYRGDLAPTDSIADFALYVAFFPQLVAGPIERATRLLPQLTGPRTITAAQVDVGLSLIVWGYLKKVMVADNLADVVQIAFADPSAGGLDRAIGIVAFTFQIYCDFSGYTDIARGVAKLLGIELMVNFRLPYFALTPSDFWRRWHISLSTWLRDYLYIPLGGNRGSRVRTARNLFLTMLLGGLWHGAAWTFVAWGAFHGGLLVGARALEVDARVAEAGRLGRALAMGTMLVLVMVGWVLFRADSLGQAVDVLTGLGLDATARTGDLARRLWVVLPVVAVMVVQARARNLAAIAAWRPPARGVAYGCMLLGIVAFGARQPVEFVYFQF